MTYISEKNNFFDSCYPLIQFSCLLVTFIISKLIKKMNHHNDAKITKTIELNVLMIYICSNIMQICLQPYIKFRIRAFINTCKVSLFWNFIILGFRYLYDHYIVLQFYNYIVLKYCNMAMSFFLYQDMFA